MRKRLCCLYERRRQIYDKDCVVDSEFIAYCWFPMGEGPQISVANSKGEMWVATSRFPEDRDDYYNLLKTDE